MIYGVGFGKNSCIGGLAQRREGCDNAMIFVTGAYGFAGHKTMELRKE